MANTAQLLEDSLLVIWNDRNADRRLEAMKTLYTPDIHFYESNTGEAIIGYQAINELISKLQAEWPIEFQFELNKPSQVNHQVQIISWNLGPHGIPPVATGMDVAVIENDLIKSLYLFLDTAE
ncbi:nuclear transport factor 2 family protein [Runella sp.]|uniref:nuclear transport factor 2 family protein n=1 Tax=Runella sp. TaxID=1960881 RepID=UPI003D0EC734